MKYTMNIIALLALSMLVSCTPGVNTQPTQTDSETTSAVESTQPEINNESGTATLELANPHPLAGETLTFEVVVETITKGEGNTQSDVVEVNDAIEVNYRGTLDDGEEFDSSYSRDQLLPFTVGIGQMISGFDAGVVGMALSEEKTLILSPEEAYGPATIRESVSLEELRSFVGPDFEIAVGATIPTAGGEATIVELQD